MTNRFGQILIMLSLLLAVAWGGAAQAQERTTPAEPPDYSSLDTELKAALRDVEGTYGLYFIDLKTGGEYGLNADEVFHAASTFKVALNFYLATGIAAGEVNPESRLTYKEKHYEEGTGRLQFREFGADFSIAELARESIVVSDNVATNMLLDYLGYANVKNFMRAQGAQVVDYSQNTTCPRDMAYIIRGLVQFAAMHPEGETPLQHMRDSIFREGIPAAVPAGIPVATKIGYWPAAGAYHDVAYVQHPARPYVLTIYSKNTAGHAAAFTSIRTLARIVHTFQEDVARHVDLEWNGARLALADPAIFHEGRVEVPVRALVDALPELGLAWNAGDKTLILYSRAAQRRASFHPEDDAYRIRNGRAYLPLRTLTEALGYEVEWDAGNARAAVQNKMPPEPDGD